MSGNQNFDNQTSYKQTYENTPSTNESLAVLNEREESNSQALSELQKEFKKERASRRRHTFIATTAIIGTILIAANFQMIAAGLVAAATIIGIVAGSLAAVAGVSFLAYKYREGIKESMEKAWTKTKDGIVYAADKTVDGAKWLGNNTVDGTKSLGSTMIDSTKHTATHVKSKISHTTGDVAKKLYNASITTNYSAKIDQLTESDRNKFSEIKEQLIEIFNNTKPSVATKYILEKVGQHIESKITHEKQKGLTENTDRWTKQAQFIKALSTNNLYILLKKDSLPKDRYLITSTFSEHYDEINKIISEHKEERLYADVSNMFLQADDMNCYCSVESMRR